MTKYELYFLVYLTFISIVSIILVVSDKSRARNRRQRISEAALFAAAALGGSAAMYLTMCLIRHKTQKNHFVFGIPLIFILQCVLCYIIFQN